MSVSVFIQLPKWVPLKMFRLATKTPKGILLTVSRRCEERFIRSVGRSHRRGVMSSLIFDLETRLRQLKTLQDRSPLQQKRGGGEERLAALVHVWGIHFGRWWYPRLRQIRPRVSEIARRVRPVQRQHHQICFSRGSVGMGEYHENCGRLEGLCDRYAGWGIEKEVERP